MLRRILFFVALIIASSVADGAAPSVTEKYTESQLHLIVPPNHIESVCGSAMFAIEMRIWNAAWVCAAPDPVTGVMNIVNWEYFDSGLSVIVRNPTPTDRNFILATSNNFIALDPVTLQQSIIGTLTPAANTINGGTVFTLTPENIQEVVLNTSDGWEIRTFPGGNLVLSHATDRRIVGHFLSPQSTQMAVLGNQQIDLYSAQNDQFIKTVQTPQIPGGFYGTQDWSGNGLDGVYFASDVATLTAMNLSTLTLHNAGGIQDFQVYAAAPINWTGATQDLAGLWYDAVRVFNPATGSTLYTETLPVNSSLLAPTAFWATDYNSDGKQDLLWTTFGGNLYYLPNGGTSRYLQTASAGYQVAGIHQTSGTAGSDTSALVTADAYSSQDAAYVSHLDIVFRDPQTLQVLSRRTDAASVGAQVFLGRFGPGDSQILLTAGDGRVAAEDLSDGTPLWEIDNDKYTSGNDWSAFAVPTGNCTGDACKRILIDSLSFDSASPGSFLQLVDTTNGNTLWSSTPDNCLGCGSLQVVLADVNGDGVPDILRMEPYPAALPTFQVLDGTTFQELWSVQINAMAVAVATIGAPNVAIWTGDSTLTLLAAADGHVIATQQAAITNDYTCCSLRFVALSATQGVWMALSADANVQWLPSDFSAPVQTLRAPDVQSVVAGGAGIVFGGGPEGIFRMNIPTDLIFANGFDR